MDVSANTITVDIADPGGRLTTTQRGWLRDRLGDAAAWLTGGSRRREGVAALDGSGEVRVRVVGDAEMAAAHERHSGVPGTTDVLTFDLRERPDGPLDVDVMVCADEAARQAASRGHAVEREVLLYAVHAVLHCLGEDDRDEASAARMHAREDEVLRAIGVGATFSVGAGTVGNEGGRAG
ncbi:MAG: rRNA maturation RNase YbeY [Phycisphaerae bacterium]|nr:rRNA maturation RNase YbeY [Phycisphaerae bacterium]